MTVFGMTLLSACGLREAYCTFSSLSLQFLFYLVIRKYRSLDSSVSVVVGFGLATGLQFPGRGKRFFSFPHSSDRLQGPLSLQSIGYQGSFMGVKQLGHEADHSSLSRAKVKNGSAIPPCHHMPSWCVPQLIKHRDNSSSDGIVTAMGWLTVGLKFLPQ
jgi:hypothetical protein